MRTAFLSLIAVLALTAAGCGPTVDLKTGLQTVDVSTGWWDAGVVSGQNKLVPTVTFKFKNVSEHSLGTLQANVIFRRAGEESELGGAFLRIAGSDGLASGATSDTQTAKSQFGYTGTEPRQQMLANTQFVDAKVQIFAKYESTQWQLVGEYPVERRVINQ